MAGSQGEQASTPSKRTTGRERAGPTRRRGSKEGKTSTGCWAEHRTREEGVRAVGLLYLRWMAGPTAVGTVASPAIKRWHNSSSVSPTVATATLAGRGQMARAAAAG